jgi:Tol biopolymer transport system component
MCRRAMRLIPVLLFLILLFAGNAAAFEFSDDFESYSIGQNPTSNYDFLYTTWMSGEPAGTDMYQIVYFDSSNTNKVLNYYLPHGGYHVPYPSKVYKQQFSSIEEVSASFLSKPGLVMSWTFIRVGVTDTGIESTYTISAHWSNELIIVDQAMGTVLSSVPLWNDEHITRISHRITVRIIGDRLIGTITRLDTNESKTCEIVKNRNVGGKVAFGFGADTSDTTSVNIDNFYVRGEISPTITFIRDEDIWITDEQGNSPINLTNSPGVRDLEPKFSPDGTKIAFYSTISGRFELWVMNSDGSNLRQLTNNDTPYPVYADHGPSWLPDGQTLYFGSGAPGDCETWKINLDGTGLQQLTDIPGYSTTGPDISHDGTKITFARGDEGNGSTYRLYVDTVTFTNPVEIQPSGAPHHPGFSPDDTQIAYTNAGYGLPNRVRIINTDGTGDYIVLTGDSSLGFGDWHPNGSRLLIQQNGNLYWINTDGTNQTLITEGASPDVGIVSSYPQPADITPPTGSITVNSGASYTNTTSVTLTLSCTDTEGSCAEMQFSNDNSNWSVPEVYAISKTWTLASGDGAKTVYVRFSDGVNWSGAFADTITLDTNAPADGTITATPGTEQIVLNWSGFSDATSGIGGYRLVYSTTTYPNTSCSNGTLLYSGSGMSYTHSNLTNGTTYYYRVCAVDNAQNTSAGATASATPVLSTMTIQSPNGGEIWEADGANKVISWKYTGNPGANVRIELLKSGVVNTVISASTAIGTNGFGYIYWIIPTDQASGTDYRIRITSTTGSYTDTSDSDFTIAPPSITVNAPNGGEVFNADGTTKVISWNFTGNPGDSVRIELLKGGVVNTVISESSPIGTNGFGYVYWIIPSNQASGSDYKIRVTSTTNGAYTDMSNSNFTVALPSLSVKAPNGGEVFNADGATKVISWNFTGDPGANVRVELLKAGVLNTVISTSTAIGTNGFGYIYWTVPSTQPAGTDYRIRVTSTTNGAYTDMSDNNFTVALPSLSVKAPNGGEVFYADGATKVISWNFTGDPGANVRVELLKAGVLNTVISTSTAIGINGFGYIYWVIPSNQTAGSDYKIRVTSTTNGSYTDTSNNNFTIAPPSIKVKYPNGGETWKRDTLLKVISWNYTGDPGATVRVELLKGGVVNTVISASRAIGTNGFGYMYWTIPSTQTIGTDYRIRVTSTTNGSYTDISDSNFSIQP